MGMNAIMVLAMVPGIQCGISLNLGLPIGLVAGLIGGLLTIEFGIPRMGRFPLRYCCRFRSGSCLRLSVCTYVKPLKRF